MTLDDIKQMSQLDRLNFWVASAVWQQQVKDSLDAEPWWALLSRHSWQKELMSATRELADVTTVIWENGEDAPLLIGLVTIHRGHVVPELPEDVQAALRKMLPRFLSTIKPDVQDMMNKCYVEQEMT